MATEEKSVYAVAFDSGYKQAKIDLKAETEKAIQQGTSEKLAEIAEMKQKLQQTIIEAVELEKENLRRYYEQKIGEAMQQGSKSGKSEGYVEGYKNGRDTANREWGERIKIYNANIQKVLGEVYRLLHDLKIQT